MYTIYTSDTKTAHQYGKNINAHKKYAETLSKVYHTALENLLSHGETLYLEDIFGMSLLNDLHIIKNYIITLKTALSPAQ